MVHEISNRDQYDKSMVVVVVVVVVVMVVVVVVAVAVVESELYKTAHVIGCINGDTTFLELLKAFAMVLNCQLQKATTCAASIDWQLCSHNDR